MEKVLRAAEREAAEIIANAEQDAAALLSRTRLDAEAEDRRLRQGWVERESAVAEAVRAGTEEVAAARRQAGEILEAVGLEAQRIRGHAHNRASEISVAAQEAAEESVRLAHLEVERLERIREAARADLDRLMRTLGGMRDALAYELETRPAPATDPVPATPVTPLTPVPQPRAGRAAALGIGNRPGDYRRARTAGIVPDARANEPPHLPTHESAARRS